MDRRGRTSSAVLAIACGVVSFGGVIALAQASVGGLGIETPKLRIDTLGEFQRTLEELADRPRDAGALEILLFGDSSMYSPEDRGAFGAGLARRLEARQNRKVRTHRLAAPGLDAFSFFFTASRAAEERPDAAVVAFNPNSLSRGWARNFGIPALAALVPASALTRAALLPGDRIGLSIDHLFTYRWVLRVCGFDAWRRVEAFQARVHEARRSLERRFAGGSEYGTRLRTIDARNQEIGAPRDRRGRHRTSALGYRSRYAGALKGVRHDHPTLQALRNTLEVLRDAQIPTLVYATPLNLEHMHSVGFDEAEAFQSAVDAVKEVSVKSGAYFVDLHAAFPDANFRDEGDHLEFAGPRSPMARLSAQLADHLDAILRAR